MRAAALNIEGYYRLHAGIYDITRWSFLFGRREILHHVPGRPDRILEVGCGTGKNITELARRFPDAHITGIDLSGEMLALARNKTGRFGNRIDLQQRRYDTPSSTGQGYNLILFSYALSMFNPGFEVALDAAIADLAPGGHIAVVDFNDSPADWFKRWMSFNHVRMEGHLPPSLHARFSTVSEQYCCAYFGLWRYFLYVGSKPAKSPPALQANDCSKQRGRFIHNSLR